MNHSSSGAYRAAENAARRSYGRLLAFLAQRSGDLASAEDALSEAFRAALEQWPAAGVPEKPEAWLLTVARRRMVDAARRSARIVTVDPQLEAAFAAADRDAELSMFPDERLGLLFACAHPEIPADARTPLMLQTVLGIDAARIASAFLASPATMSQRLVRAKRKIREMDIPLETPQSDELDQRLPNVLEAVYGAYGRGWMDYGGADAGGRDLSVEALSLARTLARFLSSQPEALGLYALLLYTEARRRARRGPRGEYIPFSVQDTRLWDRLAIERGERLLRLAATADQIGRFQLEAAIQSAQIHARLRGLRNSEQVIQLYEGLLRIAPTVGALIAQAAAIAEGRGAAPGLERLEQLAGPMIEKHQPYWALRARLLTDCGRREEARAAYDQAIGLCSDAGVRAYLLNERRQRSDGRA